MSIEPAAMDQFDGYTRVAARLRAGIQLMEVAFDLLYEAEEAARTATYGPFESGTADHAPRLAEPDPDAVTDEFGDEYCSECGSWVARHGRGPDDGRTTDAA